MTKQELINDLSEKVFVDSLLGEPSVIGSPHLGIVEYEQSILEVSGKAAMGRSVRFYVRDDGGADEVAWYKGSEPKETITTNAV